MPRPRSDIQPRIVHAAREQFSKEGVDGASLRTIARRAKTSIGMIYYYFPTKDDLFFAVVEEIYTGLLADMTRALEPDAPIKERLRRLYVRVGAVSDVELSIVRLVVREVLVSSTRLDRLVQRFLRGHIPLVLSTIADGIRDGSLEGGVHPAILLMCTFGVGAIPQLMRRVADKHLPLVDVPKGEALSNQLIEVLFRGIGGREAGHDPRTKGRKLPV
jgi:AcrR family transcriptional regulator